MSSVFLNLGMDFDYTGESFIIVREDQMIPKTHEYLFNFLEANFSSLEAYARNYLACVDTQNPENSVPGDPLSLQRIFEELFSLHPYYRTCPANASALLNAVFAGYVLKVFPNNKEVQNRILELICTDKYTNVKNVEYWMENAASVSDESLFGELHILQQNISTWIFLTLDNTNPDLAKLTNQQRSAVYSLLYGSEFTPLLETRVEWNTHRPYNFDHLSTLLDFDPDLQVYESIAALQNDPAMPMPEFIQKAITAAAQVTEDCERCIYVTESLEELLKLEVYTMIQNNIHIKRCKNCNRYFIQEKGNQEYCDRIGKGETKACNEIGKSRTYEKRVSKDNSPMALYRKAYKTHFARMRSGRLTKEEFEAWKDEAAEKRKIAESGKLDLDEFALWLKK